VEGWISGYSQYSSAESMTTEEEEVDAECGTKNPNVETDDAKQDESKNVDTIRDDEQTTRIKPQDQGSVCKVTRNICAQFA
jgi:hypothetical protein